jgi:EAL domain-containing protein (putative c-di-GMP-specific phosphodiesterase class I)
VYQPEFSIPDRRLLRFEALARWQNSRLGCVPPSKFIPVAEENGLIGELGAYVLETACREAVAWQQKTGMLIAVGVNVSAIQLRSETFIDTVVNTLRRTGLSAGYLELEMTESIMLDGLERCQRVLTQLRAAGVRLTLDDFGTGYSSLSYLPELPFERLKIDRSFMAKADHGRGGDALIASIISVAHTLGMSVVAEGIETPRDLQLISNLGADEFQGYLLGPPEADPCAVIARRCGGSQKQFASAASDSEQSVPHAALGVAKA